MHNPLRKLFTLVSLCSLLLMRAPTVGHASPSTQEEAPAIQLASGAFIPGQSALPLDPDLMISGYAPGQRGYYLVQFTGPVQQAQLDAITALGAQLLGYIPDYAFKLRMTPEVAEQVKFKPDVRWVDLFQPAYKLNLPLTAGEAAPYQVWVEEGADVNAVAAALTGQGIQVLGVQNRLIIVHVTPQQLTAVARILDVAWIEEFQFNQPHNDYGGGVIVGANTVHANGYTGQNQVVGVADSGLDRGQAIEQFPDIPNARIRGIFNWPGAPGGCIASVVDDGAQDVESGHGTHVAVSVMGVGNAQGLGRGVAPAAELVFQSVENYVTIKPECRRSQSDGYQFVGLPEDVGQLFEQAYSAGARIHNNSWGAAADGLYTSEAALADRFIRLRPDMTIIFSAGNEGADRNRDGIIDSQSLGSPATAKNVITVGASENARADGYPCDPNLPSRSEVSDQTCAEMGGRNNVGIWGLFGFTAEPWRSDSMANNPEQMAAFSSRGPTADGRIKPDVVAPGSWILSGYSDLYQEGYNSDPVNPQNGRYQEDGYGLPLNEHYKYLSGTSMSAPIVSGAAAIVREYYQKAHNQLNPSAALIKATLINAADDMLDENNDGVNDNAFPIPNVHEGWGRINLVRATDSTAEGAAEFVDDQRGLATGNTATYQFTIADNNVPFKVSLVWTDAPGNPIAGPALVNNLDLVVTSPNATTYRGNAFGGGWSHSGGYADRVNNVENVYVQYAEAGTWTVEVKATNIPLGPQPFALVIDYKGEAKTCNVAGDISCDGVANIVDLQILVNMILRHVQPDLTIYPTEWWQRADLNHDNTWNVIDLQQMINIILR